MFEGRGVFNRLANLRGIGYINAGGENPAPISIGGGFLHSLEI
jgi:hypothetical protein